MKKLLLATAALSAMSGVKPPRVSFKKPRKDFQLRTSYRKAEIPVRNPKILNNISEMYNLHFADKFNK